MGITTVTLEVKNPLTSKKITEDFLVDSGTSYTVLPKRLVKMLGLKPSFGQEFTLVDGRKIKRDIGNIFVKFGGRETATPAVLGKEHDSPLLGS